MPFSHDLLEQARHLANREPKRPRQASLRRAISTAYYSLFHFLTTATVRNWRTVRQRAVLARAFDQRKMKEVCAKTRNKQFPGANAPVVKHLKNVAATFVALQQQRHSADYDNSKRWTRTEVLTQIESAQAAFDSWAAISMKKSRRISCFSY
jgi:uncharacterized protein (UPF0332 family)